MSERSCDGDRQGDRGYQSVDDFSEVKEDDDDHEAKGEEQGNLNIVD